MTAIQTGVGPVLSPLSRTQGLPLDLSRGVRPSSPCVVVVPTYNERENITALLEALQGLAEPVDVLVVDDNSPDGTADRVRAFMQQRDGVYLLQRPGKAGLGRAYRAGFTFALRHGWDYICQMDADFSHAPADVPRLLAACRAGADIALGSRYVGGGRIEGWPLRRWLLSRTANLLAQTLLQCRIADLTGGFKCFRRRALERLKLAEVTSEGYIFQVEMNHRARQAGLRLSQVPICFSERRYGVSKMDLQEAGGGLRQLLRLARPTERRLVRMA